MLRLITRFFHETKQPTMSNYKSPSANFVSTKKIVWIDLEMTGLDLKKDRIMEAACIVTDSELNIIAEGPNLIINQPDELLNSMNSWCTKTHSETGLLEACRKSKLTEKEAEQILLNFLKKNVPRNEAPMAGNTIYMDRMFIREQMASLDSYLHYRIIDVSSIKELAHRWNFGVYSSAPPKKLVHRALDDIRESIGELKHYKKMLFEPR